LIVVIEQVIDRIISGLVLISDVKGQIDSVDVPVQEKRLISVEWETLDNRPTKTETWGGQELFSNGSGDDFVALGRGIGSDVFVQGEDLLEEFINAFGLRIDDNSGK
jgi:hypothetical protein